MTDKELIQLAAKACGFKWSKKTEMARDELGMIDLWLVPADGSLGNTAWNPLVNDGEALRLAARLRIAIKPGKHAGDGATAEPVHGGTAGATVFDDAGMAAQMRKAIVMVAAEIGKAIQETTS